MQLEGGISGKPLFSGIFRVSFCFKDRRKTEAFYNKILVVFYNVKKFEWEGQWKKGQR